MNNLLFIIMIGLLLAGLLCFIFIKSKKKRRRLAGILCCSILLACTVLLWFFPFWPLPATTGKYKVGATVRMFVDESRAETYSDDYPNRWLNVKIWYPDGKDIDKGSCPLILFSHGSFGKKESNESLMRELASHGYVVCAIDHTYQCLKTTGPDGKKVGLNSDYTKQIMSASDKDAESRERLAALFAEWMELRMADIDFVLDEILALRGNPAEKVFGLIDASKIGVMGHSLGGAAALGIGRIRSDIGAVIALEAPFMYDVKGCENGDLVFEQAPYPVPLLNVYSDSAWGILASSPQYAQNAAVLGDDSDLTYDIYVKGAGHMTLTDLAYSMPPLCLMFGQSLTVNADRYVRRLNQTYLDFFDCYLKGSGDYVPASFL